MAAYKLHQHECLFNANFRLMPISTDKKKKNGVIPYAGPFYLKFGISNAYCMLRQTCNVQRVGSMKHVFIVLEL